MITKDGEPFIATHWDGYVGGLGRDLIGKYTNEAIIAVANEHVIDFAHSDILELICAKRMEELTIKHNLTEDEIREGTRRGSIFTASDYIPSDIEGYNDWAEYQYDLKDDTWFVRKLAGSWDDDKSEIWKVLEILVEEMENA